MEEKAQTTTLEEDKLEVEHFLTRRAKGKTYKGARLTAQKVLIKNHREEFLALCSRLRDELFIPELERELRDIDTLAKNHGGYSVLAKNLRLRRQRFNERNRERKQRKKELQDGE